MIILFFLIHFINHFQEIRLRYSALLCRHRAAPLMPQQTSTFESHFLTHMQDVAGAYHKLIACNWVPILQVAGLGKFRVNCFPKAITTWLGRESNPRSRVRRANHSATLPRLRLELKIKNQDRTEKMVNLKD